MKHQTEYTVRQLKDTFDFKVTSIYAQNLRDVNDEAELLDDVKADFFHSLTAKFLYITKRTWIDIEPYVELLNPRVSNSNVDDPNKLIICISYLTQTLGIVRIIWGYNLIDLFTWVDVSYAVHPNMLLQTGGVMSMGYGILHCRSSKQNLNAKSLTDAELIGTSEYVPFNVWMVMFLKAQVYETKKNIIYKIMG